MPSASALKSKQAYNDKLCTLLDNHTRAFIVGADNVGSRQFMDIRAVRTRSHSSLPTSWRKYEVFRVFARGRGWRVARAAPPGIPMHPRSAHNSLNVP